MNCEKHPEREGSLAIDLPSSGTKIFLCAECKASLNSSMSQFKGKREAWDHAGYDYMTVSLSGTVLAGIYSTAEGLGCAMQEHEQIAERDLPAGQYTFTITCNTNDGQFHVGMSHSFTIEFSDIAG